MFEVELGRADICEGLRQEDVEALARIARPHSFRAREYLFLLGDAADRLHVVCAGKVDLCFPFTIRGRVEDMAVEVKGPGSAIGWSALIRPYRFTLSARATEPTETLALLRRDLEHFFEVNPPTGCLFLRRIGELVGRRLLQVQALWVRELQRHVTEQFDAPGDSPQASWESPDP